MSKYYPLANFWKASSILSKKGLKGNDGYSIKAIRTGENRPPKAGEWYISGAIPEAYQAPGDLSTNHVIAKLVIVQKVETLKEIETL